MIHAVARRREGMHHEVDVDGHRVVVDEPEEDGGTDIGPSPTRLLAASLASCTAMTIAMYTDRKDWDLEGMEVGVDFEGSPEKGQQAEFTVTLSLPKGLEAAQIEKIRTIAGKCPVHRTLTSDPQIQIRDEILST